MRRTGLLLSPLVWILLLLTGCAGHHLSYVQEARLTNGRTQALVVSENPPEPQVEVPGAPPGPDFVWTPGYWDWNGHWVWVSGRWVAAPNPKATWVPDHWRRSSAGWVWVHGYWR